jgi:hypothetical protein
MAKKHSYSEHCNKVAAFHGELTKGFTGLADHYAKAAEHTRAGDHEQAANELEECSSCAKSMAESHAGLAECHSAQADAARKALADRGLELRPDGAVGVVPSAPESARNRFTAVPRAGAPPEQRKAAPSVFGMDLQPDTDGVDPELSDLVKAAV